MLMPLSRKTLKNAFYHQLSRLKSVPALFVLMSLLIGQFASFTVTVRAERLRTYKGFSRSTVYPRARPEIPLPTPKSHYETFKPGVTGLPLLINLLKISDPEIQQMLLKFAQAAGIQKDQLAQIGSPEVQIYAKQVLDAAKEAGVTPSSILPKEQALAIVRKVNWDPYRSEVLEFFLHQSQVLDLVPAKWGPIWSPIIHDAMLYFLDHLSDDRLTEKMVDLAYLPPGTSRGDYMLTFVAKIPSLQKLGQILARNPDIAPEYLKALQGLENGIQTITREEMVEFISNDLGKETVDKYQVQFADNVLAEASVGAIIKASYLEPGAKERKEAVVKIVKPYVMVNMPEDLDILEGLAVYFTKQNEFYQLGNTPLVEIFRDLKKALANEIKIDGERQNFIKAKAYYADNPKIFVPGIILSLCTPHTTFMEFVRAEKITSSFPGQADKRAIMAQRMNDALTFDVIFSKKSEAIFHGDPHAGNVNHMLGDPDPYRIALLDWGLYGTFPRAERLALMQIILGLELQDTKRLKKYSGFLFEQGAPADPAKIKEVDDIIAQVVLPKPGRGSFDALQELITSLIEKGYTTKFSLTLFTKSQLTIAGILPELDPALDQDAYLTKRLTSQIKSEMPKRLLNTIFFWNWDSHSYRSLLSNKDVMAARKIPAKPKTAPLVPNAAPALQTSQ